MSSKIDANDIAAEHGPAVLRAVTQQATAEASEKKRRTYGWRKWADYTAQCGGQFDQRPPVIHGLLREGETMNLVAPSKVGKSFLVGDLILACATGGAWLRDDWVVRQGNVVLIDNELHDETIHYRLESILRRRRLHESVRDRLTWVSLRGKLQSIDELGDLLLAVSDTKPALVVLDALYRFLPSGTSENDNSDMAQVFNRIDSYAAAFRAGVVVVHHSSKGWQTGKATTDIGAGAGAMARAVDTHIVLRAHETPAHFVVEAACRTFPMPAPSVVRWEFPLWHPVADADPTKFYAPPRKLRECKIEPIELDDAAFSTHLTVQYRSQSAVALAIQRDTGCVQRVARARLNSIVQRHDLLSLRPEDGAKDCGTFFAQIHRNGLIFRLKEEEAW